MRDFHTWVILLSVQYAVNSLAAPPSSPTFEVVSTSVQSPGPSIQTVSAAATSTSPYYGYFRTVIGDIGAELPPDLTKYDFLSRVPPALITNKRNPQRRSRNQERKRNPQHSLRNCFPPKRFDRNPHRNRRLSHQQPTSHNKLHSRLHQHKPDLPPRQPRPSPLDRRNRLRRNCPLPQTHARNLPQHHR